MGMSLLFHTLCWSTPLSSSTQGISPTTTILLLPMTFSLAHIHHVYELYHNQGYPISQALQVVAFQCVYTYVFGTFACWLLVRSGSIAAPIAAHCLCNALGFPPFGAMQQHPQRRLLIWVTVVGLVAFVGLLGPATGGGVLGPGTTQFWGAVKHVQGHGVWF